MMEKFDKKLSNRIKEVIGDQNLPYNPEHWELLLDKKKKKRNHILFWRYAAILLLLISLGSMSEFFFINSNQGEPAKQQMIISNRNDSIKKVISNESEKSFIVNENVDRFIDIDTSASKPNSFNTKTIQIKKVSKAQTSSNKYFIAKESKNINSKESYKNDFVSEKETIIKDKLDVKANKNDFVDQNIVADNDLINESLKDINELVSENTKEKKDHKKPTSKSIKIGLNFSPEINYVQENNNSNFGFSGGISMDIPISNRFDIYSGMLYTNQKFNSNNQALMYDTDSGIINNENKQITSEKAILKGIEIPINLKYNFSVNDKKIFISSGISSTYYFEEKVESNITVNSRIETTIKDSFGNNIVQYELVQSDEKFVSSNAGNFNFANILNLSIGIELPLKKQNQSIVLEPYFKYSIRPITKENIDFSSAGIFLRYNFSFYRK